MVFSLVVFHFDNLDKNTSIMHNIPVNSEDSDCVAQSVGHLTRKSEVLGSKPGLATYFHFSFR